MEWTTEKPTKPGWYWWRAQQPDWPPEMCLVFNDSRKNKLIALFSNNNDCETVQMDEFEHTPLWAGPIPEPTERTED